MTEKGCELLRLRMEGRVEQEIAEAVGFGPASAGRKRCAAELPV